MTVKWGELGIKWGEGIPETGVLDPDNWLVTTVQQLRDYALTFLDGRYYTVQMSYPDNSASRTRLMPLSKTLIHFEIDHIENPTLGFGDSVIDAEYDADEGLVVEREGQFHIVYWDVGIWTSAEAGGDRARLRAHQLLCNILHGARAGQDFFDFTEGIYLLDFGGGRYFIDQINDLPVWRVSNLDLTMRVPSRVRRPEVPYLLVPPDENGNDPGITFEATLTVDGE